MKSFKLDDIDKNKKPFSVPEGYFEELPMKIQGRLPSKNKPGWIGVSKLRLAFIIPIVLILTMTIIFGGQSETPEEMLADISQEDLIAYIDFMSIEESDILTAFDGNVENIDFFDNEGFENLELEDEMVDDLILEYDLSEDYL